MKRLPWFFVIAFLMSGCFSRAVTPQLVVLDVAPGTTLQAPFPDVVRVRITGPAVVYLVQSRKIRATATYHSSQSGAVLLPVASVLSGPGPVNVRVSHNSGAYRLFDCNQSSTGALCTQICNWCTKYQNGQPVTNPGGGFATEGPGICCP